MTIDPFELFLWTFRRNENDIVRLYDSLSDVMRLATSGEMLNFGYWDENTIEPINAQNQLCKIFGEFSDLETAKNIIDIGSGFSAPAILWKKQFNPLEITCVNINFSQLRQSIPQIKNQEDSHSINLLNSTSTTLPFLNESADRILALESLQHVKNLQSFISESKRILKEHGKLTIAIPVVTKKISPLIDLGILSMTWTSEHYTTNHIKLLLIENDFKILELQNIGSKVYVPLANYYTKNRDELRTKILSKYPSYVETILFKSLQKMKQLSKKSIIDYVLIKCEIS